MAVVDVLKASVWARDGVSAADWRFRGLFRWVLPLTDVFFLWFGLAGLYNGIATVRRAASPEWQEWWSAGIALVALVAFIGVSFPRLWWLELAAKGPLIGLVSVYSVIFLVNGVENPLVQATAGLICILIFLPIWRVLDISGRDLRQWFFSRRARKA